MRSLVLHVAAALLLACSALAAQDVKQMADECAALLREEKYADAEKLASRLIRQEKDAWAGWFLRGRARQRQKDHRNALVDYNKAVQLAERGKAEPGDLAVVYLDRGRCRMALRKHRTALQDLDASVRHEATAESLHWRGRARFVNYDWAGAQADFTRASGLDPLHTDSIAMRALVRQYMGDWKGAMEDFTTLLTMPETKRVAVLTARGNARIAMGEYAGAIKDFDAARKEEPDNRELLVARAKAKEKLGDLEGARKDLDDAVRLDRRNGAVWWGRGAFLYRAGRYAQAIEDYRNALAFDPEGHEFVHLHLWVANARLGKPYDLKPLFASESEDEFVRFVGRFLAGDVDEEAFLAHVDSISNPHEKREKTCVMFWYAGVKRHLAGDDPGAINFFVRTIASQRKLLPEYDFAVSDRAKLEE